MKIRIIGLLLILTTLISYCSNSKKSAYNIPSYFPPEQKEKLYVNLEKGKLLFKAHCSACHGIFGKGVDSIPNFSKQEIADYAAAFKANAKKNHAVMQNLQPEELSMIMSFLQLRKSDASPTHQH